MHDSHDRALKALDSRGRRRTLVERRGIDFSSNDYLGLAQSRILADALAGAVQRGVPVGAGGSRLLRGNHAEHIALEEEAARFFGSESALFMGGGFAANTAIFSTLPQRGDLIVYDALVHASAHDGMRMGKAETVAAQHNDAGAFEDAIVSWRRRGGMGRAWIAVESLYSMEGDCAPLVDLAAVADRHDAMLVIDEAHATGVFGPQGRGLGHALEGRPNVITLHTCGKALGVMGGLIAGPAILRDFLINRARPFIYATAPSPVIAAAVRASLAHCATDAARRVALTDLVALAGTELAARCGLRPSGMQIQPIIAGADARAVALAADLQRQGFDVRAVRPPTVPEGTARLRLSLTLNASPQDVLALADALSLSLQRNAA